MGDKHEQRRVRDQAGAPREAPQEKERAHAQARQEFSQGIHGRHFEEVKARLTGGSRISGKEVTTKEGGTSCHWYRLLK